MSVALGLAILAAGCGPMLILNTRSPRRIEPRGRDGLVLVESSGHRDAQGMVAAVLRGEARGAWWRITNRVQDGARLVLDEERNVRRARIVGETAPLEADELWVRVEVVGWSTTPTAVEDTNDAGQLVQLPAFRSDVVLQVTIADPDGQVLLDEAQYSGEAVVLVGAPVTGNPLLEAARQAASAFLNDITPMPRADFVQLDDGDSSQRKAIEHAQGGRYVAAERSLRSYLKKTPTNAVAHYNLGVVLEGQGRHREALQSYDEAIRISARPYYRDTRTSCERRAEATEAVYGVAAPAPEPAGKAATSATPPMLEPGPLDKDAATPATP